MCELIPSKDVRDYMAKKGRKLTDFEKAVLAYNHSYMSHQEKMETLAEIMQETKDAELAKQIRERLTYEETCLKTFFEQREGMIYGLEVYMKEDRKWFDQGYFVSGELAAASGKNWGEYYSVCKIELFAEEKEEEDCDVNCVCRLYYSKDGVLKSVEDSVLEWTGEKDETDKERFENAYVDLLYPFRTGDLVRLVGENEIGIVHTERTDEEYEENRIWMLDRWQKGRGCDYTDVSMVVEYVDEDGNFGHRHVSTVNVEYASPDEKNPKKKVLEWGRRVVTGGSTLECFQMMCEEMVRKQKHL